MNKFGGKLRELREAKGLLLRQVAAYLETDTAFISKLERGERRAKREQVFQFAALLNTNTDELLSLWLADQVYELVKNEKVAIKSLEMTMNELK